MSEFKFETLDIYKSANELGQIIWVKVSAWKWFDKETLGKQLIRSADSVSLNICEGYGRYYHKDKKLFYYYSRGSLYETYEALKKANERHLIAESDFLSLKKRILDLAVRLNNFINSIGPPPDTHKLPQ